MSSTQQLEEEILYEENVESEQQAYKDQFAAINPFNASKNQQSQSSEQENISSEKQETNNQKDHKENQSEENIDSKINQKTNTYCHNLLIFQKKYRRLSSQNSNNNQIDSNKYKKMPDSSQNTSKQDTLVEILPQKSFNRTDLKNHRRSLHVISRQNQENRKNIINNEELSFTRQNKRVISQQNTYRRYAQQDINKSQNQRDIEIFENHLSKETKFRKTQITSINKKSFGSNVSSKRHQSQSLSKLDQQDLFNYPERNSQRVVVFLKTYIISPFQSVSIEVSLLRNFLIIVGNLLGQQKQTVKLVLSQQKTQKLVKESYNDWQILGKRIFLEMTPSGGKRIKISPIKQMIEFVKLDLRKDKIGFPKQQLSRNFMTRMKQQKRRQIYMRQKQFLRRNYYSIISKVENVQKTVNQHSVLNQQKYSNENTLKNTQKHRTSTIQTKQMQTKTNFGFNNRKKNQYFNRTKHLDYMSPQVKQKIQQFQNSKQKSFIQQNIQREKLKRQAFLKKQHTFIQRLSKSKDPKEVKKQNSKSKEKPFVVFKVGSLNNLAHSFVPNQRKTRIVSKLNNQNENIQNENNIAVKQTNFASKEQTEKPVDENKNEKKQIYDIPSKEQIINSKESMKKLLSEKKDKSEKRDQNNEIEIESKVKIIKIQNSKSSLSLKIQKDKNKKEKHEQEQYKFEENHENISGQQQNQYQEDQFQSENKQKQKNQSYLQKQRSFKDIKKSERVRESQSQQYSDFIRNVDDQYENQYDEFQQEKQSKIQQSKKNKNQKIQKDSDYQESYQKDFQSQKDHQNLDQEYAFTDQNNQDKAEQQNYLEQEFIE